MNDKDPKQFSIDLTISDDSVRQSSDARSPDVEVADVRGDIATVVSISHSAEKRRKSELKDLYAGIVKRAQHLFE